MAETPQNLTLSVATSMGPLFWPTRKNSTVTVFFSVRLAALERCVNRGKALARAQAEANTSERSHTICNSSKTGHTTPGGQGSTKRICYPGFYWGKKEVVGNNRALSQDKLIHHILHRQRGRVKYPSELGQLISHMEMNYTAGISSSS